LKRETSGAPKAKTGGIGSCYGADRTHPIPNDRALGLGASGMHEGMSLKKNTPHHTYRRN
jgi:hypothetical protein